MWKGQRIYSKAAHKYPQTTVLYIEWSFTAALVNLLVKLLQNFLFSYAMNSWCRFKSQLQWSNVKTTCLKHVLLPKAWQAGQQADRAGSDAARTEAGRRLSRQSQ